MKQIKLAELAFSAHYNIVIVTCRLKDTNISYKQKM